MKLRQTAARSVGAALFACGCALALPAAAADPNTANNAKFLKLDTNRDGFLSREEVDRIPGYHKAFNEADDNRDNRLDATEFLKAEANYDRMRAATYAADSVITAKVKAALLRERQLKSLDVSVETYDGQVLLSGFVRNGDQRDRAILVASSVQGVTTVKDGLVVR